MRKLTNYSRTGHKAQMILKTLTVKSVCVHRRCGRIRAGCGWKAFSQHCTLSHGGEEDEDSHCWGTTHKTHVRDLDLSLSYICAIFL